MALDNFINNKNFVLIFLDYLLLYQMKKSILFTLRLI